MLKSIIGNIVLAAIWHAFCVSFFSLVIQFTVNIGFSEIFPNLIPKIDFLNVFAIVTGIYIVNLTVEYYKRKALIKKQEKALYDFIKKMGGGEE